MCPFYSEYAKGKKRKEKYCKPLQNGAAERIHLLPPRVPLTYPTGTKKYELHPALWGLGGTSLERTQEGLRQLSSFPPGHFCGCAHA